MQDKRAFDQSFGNRAIDRNLRRISQRRNGATTAASGTRTAENGCPTDLKPPFFSSCSLTCV
jgi:hypothetical protein